MRVWYKDYVKKSDNELQELEERPEPKAGRYFQLVERKSKSDPISTISKREFGDKYLHSLPVLSHDQKLLCMPRFDGNSEGEKGIIDVFDCESLDFWQKEEPLDVSDESYKFSLKMSDDNDVKSFKSVSFSESKRFVCILCEKKIMIFDTSAVVDGSINNDGDDDEDVIKLCELKIVRTIHGKTYDGFLKIYLGFDESEEQLMESWVVLRSILYGHVHLLKLLDLPVLET